MSSQSHISRAWLCLMGTLLLVPIGLQLAGCATPGGSRSQMAQASASTEEDQEAARFKEGMDHFKKADYQKALAIFEEISRTTHTEPLRRRALYAQGCTRLILAQSAEEYSSALALWQSWSRLEPFEADEDPRMLAPILERISPTLPAELRESPSAQVAKPKKRPGSVYINKDLAAYKSMMESKQKEFDRLKTRLEGREREVRRLKQQIESLEAIHLKFQERQKEISTP